MNLRKHLFDVGMVLGLFFLLGVLAIAPTHLPRTFIPPFIAIAALYCLLISRVRNTTLIVILLIACFEMGAILGVGVWIK